MQTLRRQSVLLEDTNSSSGALGRCVCEYPPTLCDWSANSTENVCQGGSAESVVAAVVPLGAAHVHVVKEVARPCTCAELGGGGNASGAGGGSLADGADNDFRVGVRELNGGEWFGVALACLLILFILVTAARIVVKHQRRARRASQGVSLWGSFYVEPPPPDDPLSGSALPSSPFGGSGGYAGGALSSSRPASARGRPASARGGAGSGGLMGGWANTGGYWGGASGAAPPAEVSSELVEVCDSFQTRASPQTPCPPPKKSPAPSPLP